MSGGPQKMKLRTAQRLADILIAHFAPFCERIEVAGSIRRQKTEVGDIELVAIPKMGSRPARGQIALFDDAAATEPYSLLDEALDRLLTKRHIMRNVPPGWESRPTWGERMKKFWTYGLPLRIVQVDMFLASPDNWGEIFTIRTGSYEFSRAFVTHIKHKTPYRQQEGTLIVAATGEVIRVPEEEDYFRLAGLEWIEPEKRTGPDAIRPVKTGLSGNDYQIAPQTKTIKALTLHQPWASLIAARLKVYETRSRSTSYRGLLAIHAGKTIGALDVNAVLTPAERARLPVDLPRGAVVCIARLVDVVKSEKIATDPEFAESREPKLGNFAPGRYGWKLEVVRVFDPPLPARGAPGLWNWAMPVETAATTRA